MRLLTLALMFSLPQESTAEWRRTLTLINRSDEVISKGTQIAVDLFKGENAPKTSEVDVYYGGKPLVSCYTASKGRWFRLPADLPPAGRDSGYEIRYGAGKIPRRFSEVFDFYEDFTESDLDPVRWETDKDLTFNRSKAGLVVTRVSGRRNEFAPASLIPRIPRIPPGFVFSMTVDWKVKSGSAFTAALVADLVRNGTTQEDREKIAPLIRDLADEGIEIRDRALKQLIALGPAAVPQLEEAARSSDAEFRSRAVAVLDSIYREKPPVRISTGIQAEGRSEKSLVRLIHLGRSRTSQVFFNAPEGGATFTIERDTKGMTYIAWGPEKGLPVTVDGTVSKFRLDFWAPQHEEIGEFRVGRVILRRFVAEMPSAQFGSEEAVQQR